METETQPTQTAAETPAVDITPVEAPAPAEEVAPAVEAAPKAAPKAKAPKAKAPKAKAPKAKVVKAKAPKAVKATKVKAPKAKTKAVKIPAIKKQKRALGVKAQGQVSKEAFNLLVTKANAEKVTPAEMVRRAVNRFVGYKEQ